MGQPTSAGTTAATGAMNATGAANAVIVIPTIDPDGSICQLVEELRDRGFRFFELPAWEKSKDGVIYAEKK